MIKLGTMSLNVRNTTATEFAGIVSDLGLDVIELHTSAFESTDLDYLRDLKMDLMRKGLPIGYIGISNNFYNAKRAVFCTTGTSSTSLFIPRKFFASESGMLRHFVTNSR